MMSHGHVFFYEFGVNHIVPEYARLSLLLREAHLGRHSMLVTLHDKFISRVKEESHREELPQLRPWLLVQEDIQALNEHDPLLLAIEMDLILLWVLLGVVEVGEAACAIIKASLNVFDKFS